MHYKNKNSNQDPHEPVQAKPLEVKVFGGVEEGLKRFKTYFQRERVLGELKERETYEKPSEKKRRKKREAEQRRLLTASREKLIASGEWQKQQKKKNSKRQKRMDEKASEKEVIE
jgi:small subunit ribosomal protein S21